MRNGLLAGTLSFRDRRRIEKLFVDGLDWLYRRMKGQGDLPPYSLRRFVGGGTGFVQVGRWFLSEFRRLLLLHEGCRILDVGCGCGRLAAVFAKDPELVELGVSYTGMDIDHDSIDWCRHHITPLNSSFRFYHADLHNSVYNPEGALDPSTYRFPHDDGSFDLIVATSLFTHLLEPEAAHYLGEMARLVSAQALIYASFFLVSDQNEAIEGTERHGIKFPVGRGDYYLASETQPEGGVAFREERVLMMVEESGLELATEIFYGAQDNLLCRKRSRDAFGA